MKKALLVVFLMAVGTVSYAQGLSVTDDGLDKVVLAMHLDGVAMANMEMKQELNLSEDQIIQVERINEQRFHKMVEAESEYASNEILLSNSIRKIHVHCDQTLREVLDDQQMSQFLELEGRFHMQLVTENEED